MATIAGLAPQPPPHHGPVRGPPQPQLGPFNPNKLHSDPERFICIYPAYFNSNKSISEGKQSIRRQHFSSLPIRKQYLKDSANHRRVFLGRRIPKEKCVENPTYHEIKMVLDDAGYEMGKSYIIQGKYYPR